MPESTESYKLVLEALEKLGHPTRLRVLFSLADKPASPKLIAAQHKLALGNVAYHVRAMERAQLIELFDERRVRGAVEHHYKMTRKGKKLFAKILEG